MNLVQGCVLERMCAKKTEDQTLLHGEWGALVFIIPRFGQHEKGIAFLLIIVVLPSQGLEEGDSRME